MSDLHYNISLVDQKLSAQTTIMLALLQRVSTVSVAVVGEIVGAIDRGILLFCNYSALRWGAE